MDKIIKLSLTTKDVPIRMDVVQYATSPNIVFVLDDYTPPDGSVATFYVEKPSGQEIYNACTIKENQITYSPTAQSFAELGTNRCQLIITEPRKTATSFLIYVDVTPNIVNAKSITSQSEFTQLQQLIQDAGQYETIIGANNIVGANNRQYWTALAAEDDLNDITTLGEYSATETVAPTLVNSPKPGASTGFTMIVSRAYATTSATSGIAQEVRFYNRAYAAQIYRRVLSAAGWGDWQVVPLNSTVLANNTVGAQTRAGWTRILSGEDLNTFTTLGVYYTATDQDAQSLSNCPVRNLFKMVVESGANSTIWIHQTIYLASKATKLTIFRRATTDGGSTWGDWIQQSIDGESLEIVEKNNIVGANNRQYWSSIPSGTDLNTITDLGIYYVTGDSVAQSLSNCPVQNIFKMIVEQAANSVNWLRQTVQVASSVTNQQTWARSTTDGGSTWGDWRLTTFQGSTVADLNTVTSAGQYAYNAGAANAPTTTTGGTFIMVRYNASYGYQIASPITTLNPMLWVRQMHSGTWGEWKCLNDGYWANFMPDIPEGANLNDYRNGGNFKVFSNSNPSSIVNSPTGESGILKVIYLSVNYSLQEWRSLGNRIFERRLYTSGGTTTPTEWVELQKVTSEQSLNITRKVNSYVNADAVERLYAAKKGGTLFFNCNLQLTGTMPAYQSGDDFIDIAQISGWNASRTTYQNIPMQNGSGVLSVLVSPTGLVQIYNGTSSQLSGWARASMTAPEV